MFVFIKDLISAVIELTVAGMDMMIDSPSIRSVKKSLAFSNIIIYFLTSWAIVSVILIILSKAR
jgi:hypothetical protein